MILVAAGVEYGLSKLMILFGEFVSHRPTVSINILSPLPRAAGRADRLRMLRQRGFGQGVLQLRIS